MSAATELARRLSREAEAVCRHYLSNGRREGRYWLVGDVENTPGRSLFVRLTGHESGKGAAGKWTDAATGEHGDLLDLIAAARKLDTLVATLEEARTFLRLPRPEPQAWTKPDPAPQGSPEATRRLWAMSQPIHGTVAETYLRSRGITDLRNCGPLRFHPRCWYRGDPDDPADRAGAIYRSRIQVVSANAPPIGERGRHDTGSRPAPLHGRRSSPPRQGTSMMVGTRSARRGCHPVSRCLCGGMCLQRAGPRR